MAYELILPLQPLLPDLEKHLLTSSPCSLRPNTNTVNVPTHRPMSLAELQMLFTRMYASTPPGQHPVLPIQGHTLAEYVKNDVQERLLALPGQGVAFTSGKVNAHQIHSKRDSYINALLIQSRGGCCANCKWPDKALQCSLQGQAGGHVQPAIGGQPGGIQGHQGQARRLINLDPEEGDELENPINLDSDEGEEGNPIVL
ncbi:hypothetical protein BJY00DRAFT_304814 [Aspergillus carlsbadensis]|nr:hypothetical protein BJY00DRAFT_304814 [Aspergillus carlsbadensis]